MTHDVERKPSNRTIDTPEDLPRYEVIQPISVEMGRRAIEGLTVVVPAFNASSLIINTVNKLLETDADRIIICDDHSTDDTVERLNKRYDSTIELVEGNENIGAGPNRNRALDRIDSGNVLFVDADTEIIFTESLKKLVVKNLADRSIGAVGFGIINNDGEPMKWNFGDVMNPIREAEERLLEKLYFSRKISREDYIELAPHRAASKRLVDVTTPIDVGWVAEGCFAAPIDVLKAVNGFDRGIRYHEAHFIGQKIANLGKRVVFNPTNIIQHLEHVVRSQSRNKQESIARAQFYAKYWDMGKTTVEKLFEHEKDRA